MIFGTIILTFQNIAIQKIAKYLLKRFNLNYYQFFFSFCEIFFVQVLIEKIRKDQDLLNFRLNI